MLKHNALDTIAGHALDTIARQTIGGIAIGGANPCRFVAEISNNHNGRLLSAYALIDAAKKAGADFVKFQCYTPGELIALRGNGPAPAPWGAQGWTMRQLYEQAQTPLDWFDTLFTHARSIGIVPFASVFGERSFNLLRALGCPAYKIARLDNAHEDLWEITRAVRVPVIVSACESDTLPAGQGLRQQMVLYCPPGYPTAIADVHLPYFDGMTSMFGAHPYLGLSSHCMTPELPVAAVARGAKLIEMHLQLEHEPSNLEAAISLTPSQFAAMIAAVRRVEALLL